MQNLPTNVVRVAVKRPLYMLLDYVADEITLPKPGTRVKVALGNAVTTAIVVDTNVESEFSNLKPILKVIDEAPLFDTSMMSLLSWASRYYFYPIGEVFFHALPAIMRKGKSLPKIKLWKAKSPNQESIDEILKWAPKQKLMFNLLSESEHNEQSLLQACGSNWRYILRQLEKRELLDYREIDVAYSVSKLSKTEKRKKVIELTNDQEQSVTRIIKSFKKKYSKPILLHGITGSGKTEVYLRSINHILGSGKQILVMVPEIGLTPQLLRRFQQFYPEYTIALLHSGLSNTDRMQIWLATKAGSIQILIGTRSVIFTPMKELGAIIIDEEHDASFKQQEGFPYHGRDMAIKRAHDNNIPILLGSATPSLESIFNVDKGKYHYLHLSSRPGTSRPPEIKLFDTRSVKLEAGISSFLMEQVEQHIDNKHQVMLFLNRRGFAPVLMCQDCGWHASCTNCDTGMTYHAAKQKLICHHCGVEQHITSECPQCNSMNLTTHGQGTERIEDVLNSHFPNTPVIRIDRDSTIIKGTLENKLEIVNRGDPVILIGTQMLTKGHDFPNLTLVGIIDVDQALFSVDYRAQERLIQQILQVSGRAGRGESKGTVVLQTSQPQHPLLTKVLSQGYYKTARKILNERKRWSYPPIGAEALIRVNADVSDVALGFISKLSIDLQKYLGNEINLLGPVPSPLAKRANRYRFQLLIMADNRKAVHHVTSEALLLLLKYRKTGGIRWSVDIDPIDFL